MGLSCCLSILLGACGFDFADCVCLGIGAVASVVFVGDVVAGMAAVLGEG